MKFKFNYTYLFVWFMYMNTFCKGIALNNNSKVYKVLMVFGLIGLGLKLMLDRYTRKEIGTVVFLLFVGMANFVATSQVTFFITTICLSGMKGVNVEKLLKQMLNIRVVTFIGMLGLSFFGFVDVQRLDMWRNGGMVERYALGYGHPNVLHLNFFVLISLLIYVNYEKIKKRHIVICLILNFFIYYFSKSRTGFLVSCFFILVCFLSKFNGRFVKRILCMTPFLILICMTILSFLLPRFFSYDVVKKMDVLLNGRLGYSHYFIESYELSLFGTDYIQSAEAILDSGYLRMIIETGVIGLLVWYFVLFAICNKIYKDKCTERALIVSSFLVYILTESFSPNIFINYILLFAGEIIFYKHPIERNKNDNNIYTNIQ